METTNTSTNEQVKQPNPHKKLIAIIVCAALVICGIAGGVHYSEVQAANQKIDAAATKTFDPYQEKYEEIVKNNKDYSHDTAIQEMQDLVALKQDLTSHKKSMKTHDGSYVSGYDSLVKKIDTTLTSTRDKIVEEYQTTLDSINVDVNTASKDELASAKAQLEDLKNRINADREVLPDFFTNEEVTKKTDELVASVDEKNTSFDTKISEIDQQSAATSSNGGSGNGGSGNGGSSYSGGSGSYSGGSGGGDYSGGSSTDTYRKPTAEEAATQAERDGVNWNSAEGRSWTHEEMVDIMRNRYGFE